MATATKRLRPPIKIFGGKHYLARRIVDLIPPHTTYCEPFLGGGSVLLNKPPAACEVAGDLDDDLMNLWLQLRDALPTLLPWLQATPYTAESFDKADEMLRSANDGCRALGYLIRCRFSRGGMGKAFAWSDRLRGGMPGDVNAWRTILAELPAIAGRIASVDLHCGPAIETMRSADSPETLHYLDPPYCPETRTARSVYAHEMTRGDHEGLLAVARSMRGKVAISGYRCVLYDETLADWRRVEWDLPNHSGQGRSKARRVECVWLNYGGRS